MAGDVKEPDGAFILCIRVGREAGPILPTAQQVPCHDCGVKVWQSTFPGKPRHPAFYAGEWISREVPADAFPLCGPCALALVKTEKDLEAWNVLWATVQGMERPDA